MYRDRQDIVGGKPCISLIANLKSLGIMILLTLAVHCWLARMNNNRIITIILLLLLVLSLLLLLLLVSLLQFLLFFACPHNPAQWTRMLIIKYLYNIRQKRGGRRQQVSTLINKYQHDHTACYLVASRWGRVDWIVFKIAILRSSRDSAQPSWGAPLRIFPSLDFWPDIFLQLCMEIW